MTEVNTCTSTTWSRYHCEQSRRTYSSGAHLLLRPPPRPTASSGCNQLGCPYPAVCDKTSGVCTINQAQGPGAAAPQAPGTGIIANNPDPGSLLAPACIPPVPSVSNINSFCANQIAKLGGATWGRNPPVGDPSVASDLALINNV